MSYIEQPPAIYDHAYAGRVERHHFSAQQIEQICGPHALACMWSPVVEDGPCHVFLPWVGRGGVGDISYSALLRHETAHCNGWRH